MDASSTANPLVCQKSTQLQAVLHPLVLLTISDYITRHTLRQQTGPIVGALLGKQDGREVTIEHAYELQTREESAVDGGYLLDEEWYRLRRLQMILVHKDRELDVIGWYTLLPPAGPTPTILPIHAQMNGELKDNAFLLGFHPEEVLNHSVGGKLPLTIYESVCEVDDSKIDPDGEDRKMADGPSLARLKFREVPYSVETDETEMISMNYVAGSGSAAASAAAPATKEERPSRSIETNNKGKRRLVESETEDKKDETQDDNIVLTREEEEMVASLTAKANAIKMLHSRIQLITTYLERLPPSYLSGNNAEAESMDTDNTAHTTPSLTVLRQIQALVSRLDLVIPSDREAYEKEMESEANNVNLVGLLNSVIQGVSQAREVGRKFAIVESNKAVVKRGGPVDLPGGISYSMPGAGDLMI